MDPKKKKIYIAIIVVCLVLTGIILWRGLSSPAPANVPAPLPKASADLEGEDVKVLQKQVSSGGNYNPPSVFPQNTMLNTTVLNSSSFKSLQPYTPAQLDRATELGRENPFQDY